jgi:hypothetical protein
LTLGASRNVVGTLDAHHAPVSTSTSRQLLALFVWIATMTASALAIGILVATRDTPVPTTWGFRAASDTFGLTCGTVGAIVALRRPDNLNGWLFCAIGLFFAANAFISEYVIAGVFVVAGGLPLTTELGWTLTWLWVPALGIALIFLPLLFPSGHLVSPRWRAAAILGVIAIGLFTAAVAFLPGPIQQATFLQNPLAAPMDLQTYSTLVVGPTSASVGIAIALGLGSLVLRFRRATDDSRRQIKWFALATFIAGVTFALDLTVRVVGGSGTVSKILEILVVVAMLGLPTAAGMAILRYRLYDIDRIVSRTISYGVVTALLGAAYAGFILLLQGPLGQITSGDTISVALSTLAVAALFQPVRRRVQTVVDRRFDRARYDGDRTAAAFAERLRHQVDLTNLEADIADTISVALRPTSTGIWLRDQQREAAR